MDRVSSPRVPEQIQPDYSPEQVSKLLATIPAKERTDLRDRALIAMLYDTGLRCEELCHIRLADVSRETRRIIIRAGKGGRGRIVGYSAETANLLNRYMRRRGGWDAPVSTAPLFEAKDRSPLTTNAVRMLMLRRFQQAG
jgi:integrase/recombinase XerD